MSSGRFPSVLLSLCLHLGVFALVLFWPVPDKPLPMPPQGRMYSGLVTIGSEGKAAPHAGKAIPEQQGGAERPKDVVQKPQPEESPKAVKPIETPTEVAPPPEVKPIPKPEPKPEAVPIPKEPEKKPEPKPEAVPIPKEPEKKPEPKPEPKPEKKPDPKPDPKPKPKPDPKPKPKENVDNALAALEKDLGGKKPAPGKGAATTTGRGETLSQDLNDLKAQVGGSGDDARGSGPGGRGGDGAGVRGAYSESVVSRVKPNWAWPGRADRKSLTALVVIQIAADGTIEDAQISTSSGDSYFDSTVIRAVMATKVLEAPPNSSLRRLEIGFTPEGLGR